MSWLCSGWKAFYKHTLPQLRELAEACRKDPAMAEKWEGAPQNGLFVDAGHERNEPCYCGSGKKYKKCHGAH